MCYVPYCAKYDFDPTKPGLCPEHNDSLECIYLGCTAPRLGIGSDAKYVACQMHMEEFRKVQKEDLSHTLGFPEWLKRQFALECAECGKLTAATDYLCKDCRLQFGL